MTSKHLSATELVSEATEFGKALQLQKNQELSPKQKAEKIARAILSECPTARLPAILALPGFSDFLAREPVNTFAFRDALTKIRKADANRPARPRSRASNPPTPPDTSLPVARRRLDDIDPLDL